MMRLTAYFPIAPSGAGKSTYFTKLCQSKTRNTIVFSMDALRHEFYHPTNYAQAFKDSCDDKNFKRRVNERFAQLCTMAVETQSDLYIDNMNLTAKSRKFHLDAVKKMGFVTHAVLMPADVDLLISRQKTRGDKYIPPGIVRDMVLRLQPPTEGEFDEVTTSTHNM